MTKAKAKVFSQEEVIEVRGPNLGKLEQRLDSLNPQDRGLELKRAGADGDDFVFKFTQANQPSKQPQ